MLTITPLDQAVSVQEVHGIRDAMPWTPSHIVCYDSARHIEPLDAQECALTDHAQRVTVSDVLHTIQHGGEIWPSRVWCPMH